MRDIMFEEKTHAQTFWLSFLILTFLALEDFLMLSLAAQKTPGLGSYIQIYSALILGGLALTLLFHMFVTSKLSYFAVTAIALGTLVRIIAVVQLPFYSDVLQSTEEAARALLSGENPYTRVFSVGPKDVFAYPPFQPVYYLPFLSVDIRYGEVFASLTTMIIIYLAGRISKSKLTVPVLTFYSLSGVLIACAAIGTNDTSAGMLNAFAVFLLTESLRRRSSKIIAASAAVSGLAVCFKQFSIFFPIFALTYLGKRALNWKLYLSSFFSTVFLISSPYLVLSPLEFLREVILFHLGERCYSSDFVLYQILPENLKACYESNLWTIVHSVMLLALIVLFALRVKTLRECLAYSILIWLIALFLGRYVALSYLAFQAPALCLLPLVQEFKLNCGKIQ